MSPLGMFILLAIVGGDFLLYFLFQWAYGEKRAASAKKKEAQRRAIEREREESQRGAGPFLVGSKKGGPATQERVKKIRERMGKRAGAERRLA